MRVLVVEDNRDLQANIARFLGTDFQLDFAVTGPQGLTLALSHEYDVIVLDLMLPGMSGIELCQRYRQLAPRLVPILMLTARDTLEDKEEGFRAGAVEILELDPPKDAETFGRLRQAVHHMGLLTGASSGWPGQAARTNRASWYASPARWPRCTATTSPTETWSSSSRRTRRISRHFQSPWRE
ncbi:response regulator [Myxococcaceae bacterium GXIMD 01537]